MAPEWKDILTEQPPQWARVLLRLQGGATEIVSYNVYAWKQWPATHWKFVPDERQREHLQTVR